MSVGNAVRPRQNTLKPILLTLADLDEAVPWSNAVRLYPGPDIRADGRYLFLPAHRRSICRDTSNGAERLATSALSIELWSPPLARCGSVESYRWERLLCARRDDDSLRTLPHDIVFFDPDGIRLGDSGISTAATDECYPLTEAERLVVGKGVEVGPVKAVCRTKPFPDGSTLCRMRRDVGAGVSMYWDLYPPTNAIDDHLLQAENVASSICASIFNLPACTAAATAP
jgi:hypothetical protein